MADMEISRRALGAGAVGVAVLASMQAAVAQTAAAGGNWMDMIKVHHAQIADTFDKLLAARGPSAEMPLLKKLGYQLTAHSVGEENSIYPALALHGMQAGSDKLYIDQAHAKVGNTELDMMMKMSKANDPAFKGKVRALQAAVLQHAKGDEEADLYPKLMAALSPEENRMVTMTYRQQFDSVRPV